MKPGNWIIRTVMWVMMATIAAYFVVNAIHFVFDGYETAALYTYADEELVHTTGCIVREEQVVEGGSELAAVIVAEGEKVAAGDTLALVYENEEALLRHWEIIDMENRLNSLQYIFSHTVDDSDSAKLNRSIVDSIIDLKKMTASGDLIQLPTLSSQLKMKLFRSDYTYNGSEALTEEINQLDMETKALAEENRSFTTTISTQRSGTFSGMVDGYEEVLTPDTIRLISPDRLKELMNSRRDVQEQVNSGEYLGKLVTDINWYFTCVMTAEEAKPLRLGSSYPVRLSSMDRDIDMKVESISTPDKDKKVCVVFSTDRFLAEATLLRDQTADLILHSTTGFRVEKAAVHVENTTGEIGVYRVFGEKLRWTPVDILLEDEDFYLIRQKVEYDENGEVKPLTRLQEASRLRVGTQVVTKGRNLYDGKVISNS